MVAVLLKKIMHMIKKLLLDPQKIQILPDFHMESDKKHQKTFISSKAEKFPCK